MNLEQLGYVACAISVQWLLCVTPMAGQFDVVNVPPEQIVGASFESDTQVNVFEGGWISDKVRIGGDGFAVELNVFGGEMDTGAKVLTGGTLNVFDGLVGPGLAAFEGSHVSVFGGIVGESFLVHGGSLHVSGGTIGRGLGALSGSTMTVSGGVFESFRLMAFGWRDLIALGIVSPLPNVVGRSRVRF